MEKLPQKSRYRRTAEYFCSTHTAAQELADELFAPFGVKDKQGSRTTEQVKVRIRRRREQGGFRVLLLQIPEKIASEPRESEEKTKETPRKRRRARHRNDRKGKKREST